MGSRPVTLSGRTRLGTNSSRPRSTNPRRRMTRPLQGAMGLRRSRGTPTRPVPRSAQPLSPATPTRPPTAPPPIRTSRASPHPRRPMSRNQPRFTNRRPRTSLPPSRTRPATPRRSSRPTCTARRRNLANPLSPLRSTVPPPSPGSLIRDINPLPGMDTNRTPVTKFRRRQCHRSPSSRTPVPPRWQQFRWQRQPRPLRPLVGPLPPVLPRPHPSTQVTQPRLRPSIRSRPPRRTPGSRPTLPVSTAVFRRPAHRNSSTDAARSRSGWSRC